ncbi:L,D-transpeptidase family protein [Sphingomonas sp.]|uniref:L,D-transpeptidase family protein n=1 Tax=Sphingomonas sp. TaxID=28214 RepID=UPI0039C8D3B2
MAALAAVAAAAAAQASSEKAEPSIDRTVMHVQVILDRLGFSPGVIDGMEGESLRLALRGFQEAKGLEPTGKIDQPTLRALYPYRANRPTVVAKIAASDVAGPFVNPIPDDPEAQAKLPCFCYRTALEKLAERFHTTPATLVALNSPDTPLKAGQPIVVPGAIPTSREYSGVKDAAWRKTLSSLNVDANQPRGDRIVVDKSDGVLRVYAGDKVVAQFPVTMGSTHDPLPIGSWKITTYSYNPKFHYNPDLFWDAEAGDEEQLLPAGPNGPVGVIWMDLTKEHYGIHGTSEPQTIGRTESHGCIRMTNWDAARLSLIVKPGTPAIFQE